MSKFESMRERMSRSELKRETMSRSELKREKAWLDMSGSVLLSGLRE